MYLSIKEGVETAKLWLVINKMWVNWENADYLEPGDYGNIYKYKLLYIYIYIYIYIILLTFVWPKCHFNTIKLKSKINIYTKWTGSNYIILNNWCTYTS